MFDDSSIAYIYLNDIKNHIIKQKIISIINCLTKIIIQNIQHLILFFHKNNNINCQKLLAYRNIYFIFFRRHHN